MCTQANGNNLPHTLTGECIRIYILRVFQVQKCISHLSPSVRHLKVCSDAVCRSGRFIFNTSGNRLFVVFYFFFISNRLVPHHRIQFGLGYVTKYIFIVFVRSGSNISTQINLMENPKRFREKSTFEKSPIDVFAF